MRKTITVLEALICTTVLIGLGVYASQGVLLIGRML